MDHFEVAADNTIVTLYWTYLKEAETKEVSVNKVAKFGGSSCTERPSQAYLFYSEEDQVWVQT